MKQEEKWQPAFHKISGIQGDSLKLFTAREEKEWNSVPHLSLSYYNSLYSYSYFSLKIGDATLILKIISSSVLK